MREHSDRFPHRHPPARMPAERGRRPGSPPRVVGLLAAGLLLAALAAGPAAGDVLVDVLDLEPVWSGHPVGFALLTHPPHQFAAYYNAERQLTVAQRRLDERSWTFTRLPTHVGWDSHNGVTMAVDDQGCLHLAGNMHCVPLIYFRSLRPLDAAALQRVPQMVGPEREQRVTYPVFLRGPAGELIFRYRDGRSGQGDDLYNIWQPQSGQWKRLIDGPLVSGGAARNAYCTRPVRGPLGWYHMVWVWRDTPDCATNHDLSYARSRDLVRWESAGGQPLDLPITLDSPTVVDPAAPGGGLINGGHRLGFDPRGRPVIAYHKYDPQGGSQIFAARWQDGRWEVRQLSDWAPYRWDFQGGGSIPFEVRVNAVSADGPNRLRVDASRPRGRATWWRDAETLEPLPEPTAAAAKPAAPPAKDAPEPLSLAPPAPPGSPAPRLAPPPDFPGLQPHAAGDLGDDDAATVFRLHWYTRGPNRDRPHEGPVPPPARLQLGVYRRGP